MRTLYLVVESPGSHESAPPEDLVQRLGNIALLPVPDVEDLAEEIAGALRRRGVVAITYRTGFLLEKDPYVALLKPAALLRVRPRLGIDVLSKREMKQRRSKEGQVVETEHVHSAIRAHLWFEAELTSKEGASLRRFSDVAVERGQLDSGTHAGEWISRHEDRLFAKVADRISQRMFFRLGENCRAVLLGDGGLEAKTAFEAAASDDWDTAEGVWRSRDNHGSWHDIWNLGVAAERRGRLAEARKLYLRVKESAVSELGIDWEKLSDDLLLQSRQALSDEHDPTWFARRTAVLLFTDETTSIDGPVLARKAVSRILADAGYSVIPQAEVERVLRENGVTIGGHLRVFKPAQIAEWLKAERLVFGHIDRYQVLPQSIVSGEISIWEFSNPDNVSLAAAAVRERPYPNAASYLREITNSSWSDTALVPASETIRFARRILSVLPKRLRTPSLAPRCHSPAAASVALGPNIASKSATAPSNPLLLGTVRYLSFEGGFYGVVGDDGEKYDASNLPARFKIHGTRIRFRVRELPEYGSLSMWGRVVDVYDVDLLNDEVPLRAPQDQNSSNDRRGDAEHPLQPTAAD